MASAADKFQPSSSRLLLLYWPPPPGAYLQQLQFLLLLALFVVHEFVASSARVSVKMSTSEPGTNSGGQPHKPETTPSLNSTGSGTQIPSHQRNLHTHPQTIPVWPRQSWTIFPGPWPPQSLRGRGQRDKFRRRSEISQKWDDHSSPSPPNSVVVGTSTPPNRIRLDRDGTDQTTHSGPRFFPRRRNLLPRGGSIVNAHTKKKKRPQIFLFCPQTDDRRL